MTHYAYCPTHSKGWNSPQEWCYVERKYVCWYCGCDHADCVLSRRNI
jgi:hypothetical protein